MKKFIAVLIILFIVFGTINSARLESNAVDYTVSLGSLNQFSLVALHDASVSGHIRGSIWVGGTLTGECYVDDGSTGGTGAGDSYVYNNQSTVQFKGRTSEQSINAYTQLAESAIRSNANYWYDVMNNLGDNGTTCIYIAPDENGHASMVAWEQGWQQYQCAGSDETGGSCNTVYWTDATSVDVAGLEGFVIAPRASVNVLSSNNCLSIVGNSITMNWAEIHVNSGYPSTVQPTPTPTEEPIPTPTPEPVDLTINKTLIGSVWHVRCDVMDGTSFRAGGGYWKEDVIKNPAANTGKEGHRSNKCGNADNWVIWVNANGVPFRMDEIKSGATGGTLPTVLYRERIPMTGAEIQALSADDPEGIWRYSQNFQDQMDYSEIVPGQRIYWITWNGSQVWYHSGVPYKVDAPTYTLYIDGEGYNLVANGGAVTIEDLEVGIHTLVEENYPDTYISHIYVNGVSLESYDGSIEITEDTVITVENTLITPEPTSPNPPNPPVVTTPPVESETPTPETTEPDETETPEPEESETPGPEPTETEEPEPTETETIIPEPTETEEPEPTESGEPEPTESEEPEPTESEEPEPTESEEPEPTESEEPEITETPGPEPTESEEPEPEPTESEIPEPTASEEPEPTESDEPEPTESDIPEPTESEVPEPTESDEPNPTESNEPEPTESKEPAPTESNEPAPTESDEPEPTETEEPLPTPEESETPTPTPKKSDPTPTPEIIIPTVKPTETPINYCQFTVRKYVSNYWDMEPTTFFFRISGIGLEEDLYIEIYVDKNTAGEGVYKTQELRAGKYTVEEIDIPQGFYIVSDKEITKYIIGTDMEYVFENRAIPPTTPTPSEVPTATPTPEPTPTPTATVTTSPKPSEVPTDTPTSTVSETPTGTPAPTDDNPIVPSEIPPTATSTPTTTVTTTTTPTVTPTTSPKPTTTVVPAIKKAEIGHELIERPPLEEGVEAPEVPGVVAAVLTNILDYDTPLGVNVMINHVGDCFD